MEASSATARLVTGLAASLGMRVRDERARRRWTLSDLASRAGISRTHIQWIESGHPASLEAYVRLGRALGLRLEADLHDPRRRATHVREEDPVHAAMGEAFARPLLSTKVTVAIDEPYQHYQFAGRADVLAWSVERRALLHIENRTRFPNLQEAYGSYNAKRQYLPGVMADRLGLRSGFRTVAHVLACLWTGEVLHTLRKHGSSFAAVCPDPPDPLAAWLAGQPPLSGVTSSLVVVDPLSAGRERLFVGRAAVDRVRPRHRGYADVADRLRG